MSGVWLEHPTPPHFCKFPEGLADWPSILPSTFWHCLECGTEWQVSVDPWTGWWSPDTTMDAEVGFGIIKCKWETWTDCPPNVSMQRIGADGLPEGTHYSFAHPNPGPRPDDLPPLPQPRRPYISRSINNDYRPVFPPARRGGGSLSELVSADGESSAQQGRGRRSRSAGRRRSWLRRLSLSTRDERAEEA